MKFVFVLNNAVVFKGVPTSCAETLWLSFLSKKNPFQNVLRLILILRFCHFQNNEMVYFPSGFTTKFLCIFCVSPVIRHSAFQVKSCILISNMNAEMFSVLNFEPIHLLFCTLAF